jgi:hypothetical protein
VERRNIMLPPPCWWRIYEPRWWWARQKQTRAGDCKLSETERLIHALVRRRVAGLWHLLMRRAGFAKILASAILVVTVTGCFTHRIAPSGPAGIGATEYERACVWSLFWGLIQQDPAVDNCNGQPLAEVRASTNLAYALVTVLTLGIAAPQEVAWRCARAQPTSATFPAAVSGGGR